MAFAAVIFIAPQAGAQSQNLYFNDISGNDSSYINNPANWFTNPEKTERFDGTLDGSYNGIISGSGDFTVKVAENSSPVFDNFNYTNSETPASTWINAITLGQNATLKILGDFTMNIRQRSEPVYSYGSQLFHNITMWWSSNVSIGGDWNINIDRNGSIDYAGVRVAMGAVTNVGGRFQVGGNIVSSNNYGILITSNPYMEAKGAVDLGNSSWTLIGGTSITDHTRSVGGIGDVNGDGNGGVKLSIVKESSNLTAGERTVRLILTNDTSYDASTSFAKNDHAAADIFNIFMMASDAKNGRQILRFNYASAYWVHGSEVHSADINDVTVNSGRLDIGMHDAMKGGNLVIDGYSGNAADAVFSATGLSSGQEIGRVQFDSISFHEGTIVFDLGETDCDFIQINGGVTKSSAASQITFDINITKEDLQIYLEALGAETMEWDLMSFKTDDSDFGLADIILKTQAGIDGKLNFLADDSSGLTTVQLSLGAVPEPAAVAAILGAIAISLAAWRKRK